MQPNSLIKTMNGRAPGFHGPFAARFTHDFNAADDFTADLTLIMQNEKIETIQGFYFDNSAGLVAVTMTVQGTGQIIVLPPQTCGYLPVLNPNPPVFSLTCAAGVQSFQIQFLNFYVPPILWKVT